MLQAHIGQEMAHLEGQSMSKSKSPSKVADPLASLNNTFTEAHLTAIRHRDTARGTTEASAASIVMIFTAVQDSLVATIGTTGTAEDPGLPRKHL